MINYFGYIIVLGCIHYYNFNGMLSGEGKIPFREEMGDWCREKIVSGERPELLNEDQKPKEIVKIMLRN